MRKWHLVRKWPRPPEKPAPVPLNPDAMDEVCSILAEEFDEPGVVLARYTVHFPGWARREFESVESIIQEMKRKHAPLLDVIRSYHVRIYDGRQHIDIEYRRLWLFDFLRTGAEGGDKAWRARAAAAASRALEGRGERYLEGDFPVLLQGTFWLAFQAFSGITLLYLWAGGGADAWLLWMGAAAFALAAATFAPGLTSRMFPSGSGRGTGVFLRRLCGVVTVLSSIVAAAVAMYGLSGL